MVGVRWSKDVRWFGTEHGERHGTQKEFPPLSSPLQLPERRRRRRAHGTRRLARLAVAHERALGGPARGTGLVDADAARLADGRHHLAADARRLGRRDRLPGCGRGHCHHARGDLRGLQRAAAEGDVWDASSAHRHLACASTLLTLVRGVEPRHATADTIRGDLPLLDQLPACWCHSRPHRLARHTPR